MEYVHSALLLHSAGKEVNEENLEKVLEAAGVEVDSARVKSLVAALDGVDIEEAMNKAVAGSAPAQPASGGSSAEEAEEAEPEEEEAEEEEEDEGSEEEAAEGLGELF